METYRSGHNGADSKSVSGQPHKGSNPFVSANKKARLTACFFIDLAILFRIYRLTDMIY